MTDSSWNIKPTYQKNVLVGNWFEERLRYQKNRYQHNSTHRTDYIPRPLSFPDLNQRLKYWVRSGGLEKEHILGHHGKAHIHNNITWYDEDFNKRERTGRNVLPKFREWDSGTLSWRPERRDFPIQGEGTKWGLKSQKEKQWLNDQRFLLHSDMNTTYSTSYVEHPTSALMAPRAAAFKERSSRNHPLNQQQGKTLVCPPNAGNLDTVAV